MYNPNLESKLIVINIEDIMQDFVSIQFDMDGTKLRAAQKLAIDLELTDHMTQANIDRCIDQADDASEADVNLINLVVPALCHYTHMYLLKYFQGTQYDSGFGTDEKVASRTEANNASSLAQTFGNKYMEKVVAFLEAETPARVAPTRIPNVSTFGGEESWGN